MGKKWKTRIVVGLFVCGGLGFVLALLPGLSSIFWLLWLTGCAACILGLVLAVTLPASPTSEARPGAGPPGARPSRPPRGRAAHAGRRERPPGRVIVWNLSGSTSATAIAVPSSPRRRPGGRL